MSLLKINKNENPYSIIGNYIENHISLIDNIIATISIDGIIHNELFLVEITYNNNFVWLNDWWEGEENIELIDFFFVSDACKKYNNNDFISRQLAIDALRTCYDTETITMDNGDEYINYGDAVGEIEQLPSAQPKRGKWIDKFEETRESLSYCNLCGYPVSYFYKTNFCPSCGAKMEVK